MNKYPLYRFAYGVMARLPWWLIRLMSYLGAIQLYAVVRYRRKVVEANLRTSLPELTPQELRDTTWAFYQHLVLQMLSTPKILSQPIEVIRTEYLSMAGIDECSQEILQSGVRVGIVMLGHIGNWEILSAGNAWFAQHGIRLEQLYRPLKDASLDAVQLALRSRHGARTTPKADAGRRMIQLLRDPDEPPTVMAFIADQTPSRQHTNYWTSFLGQETAFLDGAERLALRYDLPVYYCDVRRVGAVRYTATFVPIRLCGERAPMGTITERYAQLLEATIRRDPAIWLWSHRRWKHKRTE